jgi:ribosomal protein L37AE/L43A
MRPDDPPADFARVREVLRGATVKPSQRPVVTKLLRVLFMGDLDAQISAHGFIVKFDSAGRIFSYVTEPAAAVIQALLRRARICPQGQAVSFRIEHEDGHALVGFPDAARWVWIVPGEHEVLVSLRRPTTAGPPPPDPAPLPEPSSPRKRHAHLAQPYACPCCDRPARVFRVSHESWICGDPHCGRSFSPPAQVRALAELREDAGVVVRESTARPKIYR